LVDLRRSYSVLHQCRYLRHSVQPESIRPTGVGFGADTGFLAVSPQVT